MANWQSLSPDAERVRRTAWLDEILYLMERQYPGFAAAVTNKPFVSVRSVSG